MIPTQSPEEKACPKCGFNKNFSEFHKSSQNKDGLQRWCKLCDLKGKKEYYKNHRDDRLEYYKNHFRNSNLMVQRIHTDRRIEKSYMMHGGGRYVHVVIAEQILDRPLKTSECVHHLDGNGLNNSHDNLLICTRSYHTYLHHAIRWFKRTQNKKEKR